MRTLPTPVFFYGMDPGEQIDIDDLDTLRTLVKAIIRHENGRGPEPDGGWYSDDVIDEGIRRAA